MAMLIARCSRQLLQISRASLRTRVYHIMRVQLCKSIAYQTHQKTELRAECHRVAPLICLCWNLLRHLQRHASLTHDCMSVIACM